ncbi:BamA/TamA family outer membrane protein [Candidatus Sumerlaeota bacterium]|nr:BamA/TamA family outer membrane protein [Candidatus Sumerlaeota bacterium]
MIISLRNALLDLYLREGLAEANVDINVIIDFPREPSPGEQPRFSQAVLQIMIEEGQRILTDDLVLEGNDSFSTLGLKFRLETKGSWWFIKNYFSNEIFEEDLIRLRSFYASHGYFDALVERGIFEEREEKDLLVITPKIKIYEGEKYRLASVDVRGARLFSRDEILDPFEGLVGEEFNARTFAPALEEVQSLYYASGFLTTEIRPVYDYDSENKKVDLTLEVDEKDRIYVGEIRLGRPRYEVDEAPGRMQRFYESIAPPITDEAIKREVLLKPGEVYSKTLERDTLRQLDRLGVFSEVQITNVPTENPRVHDVLIAVEEGGTGGFFGGIGFGDVDGGFLFGSFTERNLFGEARDFRAQIQVGTRSSSIYVSYLNRHFRDSLDQLSTSIFYSTFYRPGWRENVTGVNAEITRPLYGDWYAALAGRLEFVNLDERAGRHAEEDLDKSYPVITARLTFFQDSRYPALVPVEGRFLSGSVEAGWADGPLLKFRGSAEYLIPVGENLTYRFRPSIGLIPYSSSSVGLTERFFLGGTDDLRGFEFMGAGRRDSKEEDVSIGGAIKLLVRNELMFPLYDPVSGVIFLDVGTLGKNPISLETPRLSIGFGFRLSVPFTIAVDFALPIIRQSGDQTQFAHFSFQGAL